jgi:hypothetical protein
MRGDVEIHVKVEGTVEWEGRGRHARVIDVEVDHVKCECGGDVDATDEDNAVCAEALRESSEIDHGDWLIDRYS